MLSLCSVFFCLTASAYSYNYIGGQPTFPFEQLEQSCKWRLAGLDVVWQDSHCAPSTEQNFQKPAYILNIIQQHSPCGESSIRNYTDDHLWKSLTITFTRILVRDSGGGGHTSKQCADELSVGLVWPGRTCRDRGRGWPCRRPRSPGPGSSR